MPRTRSTLRRSLTMVGAATVTITALAACSGGGGGGTAADEFTFLAINENTTIPTVLTSLSENECSAQNDALPLKINKQAQASLDQQLQLLGGQDALPSAFISANSPDLMKELSAAGKVADFAGTDVSDQILPVAASSLEGLYGDEEIVLPSELNIEGIWYNEQLLEDNGVEVPESWGDLTDSFATLSDAGVQPISAAGQGGDGWGVTRWVGAYIFRDLGPDAMRAVDEGDAKVTDDDYVAAADAVGELGAEGYFGPSPSSIDYATAMSTFLSGDAAYYYMGSWAVSNFNDDTQNKIGADNIGFLPFPEVDGGKGSADQTPANTGTGISFSASAFEDDRVKDWADCIAENYGTVALREASQISGFTVNDEVETSDLTQMVQEQIDATDQSIAWFEALMSPAATTASQSNGGPLGAGQLDGAGFMSAVQSSIGN